VDALGELPFTFKCDADLTGVPMSEWQKQRGEANARALARLRKTLPDVFPSNVLSRALVRPFIPPTPRLAIDSYWRAHPLRADRLARALAALSGQPNGWIWQLHKGRGGRQVTFRMPPAPYREKAFARGGGFCCVCGQPVYQFGWHIDLRGKGPNRRATWHCACVVAWEFWNSPSERAPLLRRLQARRCGQTGGRLWKDAEVDHRVPLHRVWGEHRNVPWPLLLNYWGMPNLQVINRDAHVLKSADEARDRGSKRVVLGRDSAVGA
jgi:hypothetical protein